MKNIKEIQNNTITSLINSQIDNDINSLIEASENIKVSIDYLTIQTNYVLDEEDILLNFNKVRYFIEPKYRKADDFNLKTNKNIKVQVYRDFRNKSRYKHKVEIVPAYTNGKKELFNILKLILGEQGLKKNKVSRLDIAFCFPPSCRVNSFFYITDVMHKQYSAVESKIKKEFRCGAIESYYMGKLPPCRISIYTRYKDKQNENTRKQKHAIGINFEVQIGKEATIRKIPFNNVRHFDKLTLLDPLKDIYFYDIRSFNKDKLTKNRLIKHTVLRVDSFALGFGSAKALYNLNNHGHFERDLGDVLKPLYVDQSLTLKSLMQAKFKDQIQKYINS